MGRARDNGRARAAGRRGPGRLREPQGPLLLSAEAAVELIGDGAHLAVEGSGGGLLEPDLLLARLGERFASSGSPRGLTVSHCTGIGDREGGGMDRLAQPGLLRRVVAGNWGMAPRMSAMAVEGAFEAYNLPQGVMSQLYREMAAGRPGLVTHVGLGTFCDPRDEGGRLNAATREELVEVVELAGREWLFYRALPAVDVCFLRATTADEQGNLTLEHEPARLESLAIAQATRNTGGTVIAQVKRLAAGGTLDARDVVVPGILVDVVVVHPEQRQLTTDVYNAAYSGEMHAARSSLPSFPLDQRKVIARRALAEIRPGEVVNLGVGIADGIASVAAEEGRLGEFTLTIEQGVIGGIPARGVIFGVSANPVAFVDQPAQFDFYDGGGLDVAFLGFAQVDRHGNVNVSRFGSRLVGTGGFVNISQNARRVVFCGTLTAGGLEAVPSGGGLRIAREGAHRKFVDRVEQVTFNATEARRRGQEILYVTERAVLRLGADGPEVVELAPGIDPERDVADRIGFPLALDGTESMDPKLFRTDGVPAAPTIEVSP